MIGRLHIIPFTRWFLICDKKFNLFKEFYKIFILSESWNWVGSSDYTFSCCRKVVLLLRRWRCVTLILLRFSVFILLLSCIVVVSWWLSNVIFSQIVSILWITSRWLWNWWLPNPAPSLQSLHFNIITLWWYKSNHLLHSTCFSPILLGSLD